MMSSSGKGSIQCLSIILLLTFPGSGVWGTAGGTPQQTPREHQFDVDSFEQVWRTVFEKHFDPSWGGVDWPAVHNEFLPKVEAATSRREARTAIQTMLSRLKLTHFTIIPSEAYGSPTRPVGAGAEWGVTGIHLRVVDLRALVTSVDPGSAAELAGIRPGWEILRIGDKDVPGRMAALASAIEGKSMKELVIIFSALLALASADPAVAGDPASRQDTLPGAEQILDQYITAIGGLPALEKINNRVSKGSMEISGAGITISILVYQARPNKSYTVIESPATGKIESGTDGNTAWQVSAMAGPQVMEGQEKANFLHMNLFDRLIYWRTSFQKVETTGIEEVAGKACYKVVAVPAGLPPQTLFFDRESHLLVRVTMTVENQAGTFPSDSDLSDYKVVNGIALPHRTVTRIIGQERITTMESIEQNVDLAADRFEPPAEIKALIKKD